MQAILKNKFNITVFVVFFVIGLIGVFHHEIWRDEGQVWLVVRDLNIFGIFDHVRVEGHPLLWYFFVLPLAKLNLPVFSMQLLSFCFMAAAAAIFLWFSPFSKLSKICVLFSAGILYSLTVISRNYSIIPLFVFLTAVFYNKQRQRPYIYSFLNILLANTHVLMFGFCFAAAAVFGYENIIKNKENIKLKRDYIISFALMLLSLFSIVVYVFSSPLKNFSVNVQPLNIFSIEKIWDTGVWFLTNLYFSNKFVLVLAAVSILCALIVVFLENKKVFFITLAGFLSQLAIFVCGGCGVSNEKAVLSLIILLFGFWIILQDRELSKVKKIFINILVILIFGLSFNLSYMLYKNDYLYDYSGSKRVAEFIKNNIEKDAVLVSTNDLTAAGAIAYLPPERKFYTYLYDNYYSYAYAQKYIASKPFEFKKPEKLKGKKVYYLYSALGFPQTDKKIIFISDKNTLIVTEYFFVIKDE